MIPAPRKDYYYPVSPARAAKLTMEWRRYIGPDPGETFTAPISFANPRGKAKHLPLVELERQRFVTVFSVPNFVEAEEASRAVELALKICGELSRSWTPPTGRTRRWYVVGLEVPSTLILLERSMHYQLRRYRGTEKFSNSFKPRRSPALYKEIRRIRLP